MNGFLKENIISTSYPVESYDGIVEINGLIFHEFIVYNKFMKYNVSIGSAQ